ncbi:membrane-spanning 4-domains subfamily A member 12-like isoform X2 [Paroedura picta]|uniref:membrane-spanning 4-domains subfamily A member 12-like isoform X2 n=1 Tax=Paroedura picta TaxID=143630 RepID=UPI00405626A3
MATDPQTMANGAMFFVPSYSANVIQAGQIIPGTVIQPIGVTQYAGQPISPPQQNPQEWGLDKLLKVQTKTLGAVQIMVGLMHIGFGALSFFLSYEYYVPVAAFGGYPFWGGLFFIISGSISVSAENHLSKSLVQCSVGMNISVGVGLGILLLFFSLLEFCITVSTAHFGCQVACCKNDPTMVFMPYTINGDMACAESSSAPPAYEAACPR